VIHRHDAARIGKGYALDRGARHLQRDPPQVVVAIDADTPAREGAIDALARLAHASQRPVQAAYLLEPPPVPGEGHRIAAFAVLVKNCIRPTGLARLGLPCLLSGSGMAFPWPVVHQAELASGWLAHAMMLTAQLALRGHAPLFCAEARITGLLPEAIAAVRSQRKRWEHGHLYALLSQTPRLIASGVQQRRLDLIALGLEMAVPPLSLLALLWMGSTVTTTLAGLSGLTWVPAALLAAGALVSASATLVVWARFGQAVLPLRSLLAIPGYVLAQVPNYVAFVLRRQVTWVRTASNSDGPPPGGGAGSP
jgi:cellulose synthase/poly-beta-1,6-N-acetylglucosamine synthase-like glycosyltransferase